MLINIFGKIIRSYKFRNTKATHTALISKILEDSGLCEHTLKLCISKLIFNTKFTTRDYPKPLPKLFSHDLDILDKKYRASMAFIFDELLDNVLRYRAHISPFEAYCLLGKCLHGK